MTFLEYINKHVGDIPQVVEDFASGVSVRDSRCSLIRKYRGRLYELVFAIRKNAKGTHIQQILAIPEKGQAYLRNCYYNLGGSAAGLHCYGFDGKGHSNMWYDFEYNSQFGEAADNFPADRVFRRLLNVFDVPAMDPMLTYWSYANRGVPAIEYIRIYRAYPRQAEMLMKFNLTRMLSMRNCERLAKQPHFHRWLERNHEKLKCESFQMCFNTWKRNPEGSVADYIDSLVYRIETGKSVALRNKELYQKILKHTTRERILKYITDNRIGRYSYDDYITACDWLKLDLSDTKVLFPHNFKEVHDDYTKQYSDYINEQNRLEHLRQVKENEIEQKTRAMRLAKVAKKYAFLGGRFIDYTVLVAQDKMQMIDEGSALHHCVGKMDYDKRMANEESIICFIRRNNAPSVPFVTVEVGITKTSLVIRQCNGDHNRQEPEIIRFTETWIEKANRRYNDTRKQDNKIRTASAA